jgi:sirohydrochlorin ferrochelatase
MHEAVIVAHGSPADPLPQEEALAALAAEVEAGLPGWRVRGATLAAPGSLATALDGFSRPLVYPFFMAEGYFTGEVLPRRLREMHPAARQLPAFGSDPELPRLVSEAALAGTRDAGLRPETTALLLAAHGSQVSPASRMATLKLAEILSAASPFRAIVTGFIEEAPFLTESAQGLGDAICLPLFTLNAGHVIDDVPEALAEAGFTGRLLRHIGAHRQVPGMIAAALARHAIREAA